MDYAKVKWTIEDIRIRRPNWTIEQCEEFLENIEDDLVGKMIEVGWEFIDWKLENEDPIQRNQILNDVEWGLKGDDQ